MKNKAPEEGKLASNSTPSLKEDKQRSLTAKADKTEKGKTPKSKKGKKKHSSALAAAAMARPAVTQVKPSAYRDTDYMHTGTNLSYHEQEEAE